MNDISEECAPRIQSAAVALLSASAQGYTSTELASFAVQYVTRAELRTVNKRGKEEDLHFKKCLFTGYIPKCLFVLANSNSKESRRDRVNSGESVSVSAH